MLDDLDQNSRAILEGVVRRVTSGPGTITGQAVIDVGCGEGRLLARLAELGASQLTGVGWKVTVPSTVEKMEGVDLCRAGWALQFEGRVFDWIVSTEVLEHLINPFHYLVELRRLISPQGRLVLTFPNVHNLRAVSSAMHWAGVSRGSSGQISTPIIRCSISISLSRTSTSSGT